MNELQKRRCEILDQTIAAYTSETLARSEGGNCKYITSDGRKCAIGRLLPDDFCRQLESTNSGDNVLSIFCLLPDEITSLGASFLSELQELHDTRDFWDSKGLTESGKEYAESIRQDYC